MNVAARGRLGSALVAGVVALVALFAIGWDASTRILPAPAALVLAEPAPNALLADAPDRIVLTFSEAVEGASATVRLLGAGGVEIPLEPVYVDVPDPSQIAAQPSSILGGGDYMVVWSARTASEGALLAGAYPFRSGVIENPGAALLDWQWPAPWATLFRAIVFLGTSLAVGGFGWSRLLASGSGARPPGSLLRGGAMAGGALIALVATLLPPLLQSLGLPPEIEAVTFTATLRTMPLGWWLQLLALAALVLLCLRALAGSRTSSTAAPLDWAGLAVGLAAFTGLSFTSHAASSRDSFTLAWEVAHQWSTALWFSGLIFLAAGWRALGSDIAHFRTVRWVGGALIGISVLTGLAVATPSFPSIPAILETHYGRVLAGKSAFVLVILGLGLLAMNVPRRASARGASGSLAAQGVLGLVVTIFAAVLALMAAPGVVAPVELAGVDLVDVVSLDAEAFGAGSGLIHLVTQPGNTGPQTVVVRMTGDSGAPLVPDLSPDVQVDWTALGSLETFQVRALLRPDPSGALFIGAVDLAGNGWWRADVVVTPPGGIASRARFWLVLPDPTTTGRGLETESDAAARELYERGLESLTSLRSLRISQLLNDGSGSLERSRSAVSIGESGQSATYAAMELDAAGRVIAQQRIIGDRRWILVREEGWIEAEPQPIRTPAEWGETYAGATGFQLGPREAVDGELCQAITFWQPPDQRASRAPAWFVWWIGLASGEVRQESVISPRRYLVSNYSDFNAPLGIAPPVTSAPLAPAATPMPQDATPIATPAR